MILTAARPPETFFKVSGGLAAVVAQAFDMAELTKKNMGTIDKHTPPAYNEEEIARIKTESVWSAGI